MTKHNPVPLDVATEIRELSKDGVGSNQICIITGIPTSTVRNVILGEHRSYCDKLSTRQAQRLLNNGFRS